MNKSTIGYIVLVGAPIAFGASKIFEHGDSNRTWGILDVLIVMAAASLLIVVDTYFRKRQK